MKITNKQLKQIIKEELSAVLNEQEGTSIPEGTGDDFEDWVYNNIFMSEGFEFVNYRSAMADHSSYYDHPNSILFDDEYSQEEKDQEERELSQKWRETEKIFEAFRSLMQKGMTKEQIDKSDDMIEEHLQYI